MSEAQRRSKVRGHVQVTGVPLMIPQYLPDKVGAEDLVNNVPQFRLVKVLMYFLVVLGKTPSSEG